MNTRLLVSSRIMCAILLAHSPRVNFTRSSGSEMVVDVTSSIVDASSERVNQDLAEVEDA